MQIQENNAKACISIQRCNMKVAAFHNSREGFVPETSRPELSKKNRCSCSALAALQKIKEWDAKADESYAKTHGGRRSPVKEQNKVWEAVINLNSRHEMKDVKKLVKKLEQITGYKAAQIALHKDEGHIDEETGNFVLNIHAHVIFYARDVKTGLSLSTANFGRKDLMRLMQDAVADELKMERGRPAEETRRKHLSPRAFKAQKRQEAALEQNNKEWEQKLAQKDKEWQEKQAAWEAKQAEREAKREEWERKLPEIMEARRRNEQFLNGKVDWETLKTANRAFMAWHDISTDILGYPNPNGNLLIEQTKGALSSVFKLFGSVSQLAIFLLTRTEAKELKLQNTLNVYKVSENLQRAINLVKNDTTNDHQKIIEKIQNVYNNLPVDKRQELIELAILHAPNSEIREDLRALVEGRFSDIARTEQAQKRIENRDLRAELKEYAAEAKRIRDELKQMDEENRILNVAERELLKQKGAQREEYANQEAENRERVDELSELKQQAKDLNNAIREQKQSPDKDAETIKRQAEKIAKLTAQIAEMTKENAKKQKELDSAKQSYEQAKKDKIELKDKIEELEAEKIIPQDIFDEINRVQYGIEPETLHDMAIDERDAALDERDEALKRVNELEEQLKQHEEPKQPEPEKQPEPKIEPKPAKDDYLNIFGYQTYTPEPRRRFDDIERRPREPDRPRYEPEPEKYEPISEPEKPREEPIFRDPWTEIQDAIEKWKKCESEVEKKMLSPTIIQKINEYEKSGWDIPLHRQMSLDSFRRALAYDPANAIEREREERKRQAERETEKKYEEVKTKNIKQEADARQRAIKKKKDELEFGSI
jgi:mobilization protein